MMGDRAMRNYHGSCHCGRVRFRVTTSIDTVVECNCSICTRKGALHHRVGPEQFTLLAGKEFLTLYQFDSREASHYFCSHCGIHPFSRPRLDPSMYSINIRCLDDFDLEKESYEKVRFDGRNWEEAAAKLRSQ